MNETSRKSLPFFTILLLLLFSPLSALGQEAHSDLELWSGGLFRLKGPKGIDFSGEYQVRLDENLQSLKSHFFEFMGYGKVSERFVTNGGYRFTIRPDNYEHRMYAGFFWGTKPLVDDSGYDLPLRVKAIFQCGYQRDFNIRINNRLTDSNSIRYILMTSMPGSNDVTPFLLGGVLTTWNSEQNFDLDKTRLGGGVLIKTSKRGRFRVQYIFEISHLKEPIEHSHIIWMRWEVNTPSWWITVE